MLDKEPRLLTAIVEANKGEAKAAGRVYNAFERDALHENRMTAQMFSKDLDRRFGFNGSRPEPKEASRPVIDLGMRHY